MTISELLNTKRETGLSCEEIASRSGVPLSTVQKVFSGVTKTPRSSTLEQLSTAFGGVRSVSFSVRDEDDMYGMRKGAGVKVSEPAYDYGGKIAIEPAFESGSSEPFQRQGTYTIDDYYRLPYDRRVELIDGVFYDMGVPSSIHQHLVGFIYNSICNYIVSNDGDCIPFAAPTDVRLDILKGDRTMVEPDVFIVCDDEKVEKKYVREAPDFVVEVLSPSTRKKDLKKKLLKYTEAGVREYWMIDPEVGQIMVHDIEHGRKVHLYSFGEEVPVLIYNGDLKIDFSNMPKFITRWYDEDWNLIED